MAATWFGRAGSVEESAVKRHGVAFRAVAAAPLIGVGPTALVRSLRCLLGGTLAVWRHMGLERPDVVLVTGGYVTVPVALAARLRSVPLVVYLPDARPGTAVRLIARVADRIATTTEAALSWLPAAKTVVTGYPVRSVVRQAERSASRARLGLSASDPVVLVFGGSQGARRLNHAVVQASESLLARTDLVHVTGSLDHESVLAARGRVPDAAARRWHVFEYLHGVDMAAALAAADLAVSRAGAATLGEYPAVGLPAVLVPLPIAGGHQAENARILVRAGAAVMVDDAALDGDRLTCEVLALLDDPTRRRAMAEAVMGLDHPDAAAAIWREVAALAQPSEART